MSRGAESTEQPGWASREVAAMTAAWERGDPVDAAAILAEHPEVDVESAIRLIYEEVSLRREAGEEVKTSVVVARFPRWGEDLRALFDCDRLIRDAVEPIAFPEVGESIGAFQLVAELGRGAAGRTYLATDPNLANRPVVLKIIPDDQEEHLALATLRHTHIVPLFSEHSIPERGLRLLCMPYLGGASVAQILADLADRPIEDLCGALLVDVIERNTRAPGGLKLPTHGPFRRRLEALSYEDAVSWIVSCLADALQYAHERGLVHMDIKPSNVLITVDGQPILLDFHLSRPPIKVDDWIVDRLGGTPGYMSPEQELAMAAVVDGKAVRKAVDGRTDIYSLGVLLEEMLGPPGRPSVSTGLRDIIAKCRAFDPEDRYQHAAALAEDLRRHSNKLPLKGVDNRSWGERWSKWRSRRPGAIGWAAGVVGLATAAGLFALVHRESAREVEATLEQARILNEHRRFDEAIAALKSLDAVVRWMPDRELRERRDLRLRSALRGVLAEKLHELAERCRTLYGFAPPVGEPAATFAGRCAKLWEKRSALTAAFENSENERRLLERVRADLVEIAAVWTDVVESREKKLEILSTLKREGFGGRAVDARLAALGVKVPPPAEPAPDDAFEAGRELLRRGDWKGAADQFEKFLDRHPEHFWAHYLRGECEYRLKRHAEAAADYSACVALRPESARCRYNRAIAHAATDDRPRARADFDEALRLDPALVPALLNRGRLSYLDRRYDEARVDFETGLKLIDAGVADDETPLLGRLHYQLALVDKTQGDLASALRHAERAEALGLAEAKPLRALLKSQTF